MSHIVFMLVAALAGALPISQTKLPASLDLDNIRAVTVQHDGRWPPLDTVARDVVQSVTGEVFFEGNDPVLLMLGWTFDPQTSMHRGLISIGNTKLREELELSASKTIFSYAELVGNHRISSLIDQLSRRPGRGKLDPLESKVADISQKLGTLRQVFHGLVIKPIPDPTNILGTWQPVGSIAGQAEPSDNASHVQKAWADLQKAFLADDAAGFAAASDQFTTALASLPAAHRPTDQLITTELHYNKLRPFDLAWMIMAAGAVLAAGAMLIRRKWFDGIVILALVAGFALLTYGLSLRWQIAGRIPAANMFESLLFLSWGTGGFAILAMVFVRHRIVPLTASGMGALSLLLAVCLPIDQYIRPPAPVLMDTVWMSIHVPVIMVSYSVLALAVLIAHVQLVTMALAPKRQQFIDMVDSLHYWYVYIGSFLLIAGIITGSMWAASSWGRYWGWDPKEVWSLVAFLGYLIILHVRADRGKVPLWAYLVGLLLAGGLFALIVPRFAPLGSWKVLALAGTAVAMIVFVTVRGQFATAAKSILAFWLIIMTYVGVNYVLGTGLHSYGFGTGAVVHYMFLIGGTDLLLVLFCWMVYVARLRLMASVRS